jgi:hypothetical protein
MTDRVLKPELVFTQVPKEYIKFIDPCQLDQVLENINVDTARRIYELSCEVELKNFDLNNYPIPNLVLYVCVSIVSVDNNVEQGAASAATSTLQQHQEHPFVSLKCLDDKTRLTSNLILKDSNMFLFEIDKKTMKSNIKSIFVVNRTELDVTEYFEKLVLSDKEEQFSSSNLLNPNGDDSNAKINLVESIENRVREKKDRKRPNSDKFRLKLQVIIYDKIKNKSDAFLTEPVYTNFITNRLESHKKHTTGTSFDRKDHLYSNSSLLNKNNLRILRSSRIYGSTQGGDEIILLTSYVDPFDIQVGTKKILVYKLI